jgi:hypothetical protein
MIAPGSSPSPSREAETLLAAIGALDLVLAKENAALSKGDREGVRALAEEKRLACRGYEEAARTPPTGLDKAMRERLRQAMRRLTDTSAENRRRLSAALAAHHRLMQLVAEAVREQQPGPTLYTRGGPSPARVRRPTPPPAFSFDRAL